MVSRRRVGRLLSRFDSSLLRADMEARGLNQQDLAAKARVSAMTVTRFLRDEVQTPKTAKKLAAALGRASADRYRVA